MRFPRTRSGTSNLCRLRSKLRKGGDPISLANLVSFACLAFVVISSDTIGLIEEGQEDYEDDPRFTQERRDPRAALDSSRASGRHWPMPGLFDTVGGYKYPQTRGGPGASRQSVARPAADPHDRLPKYDPGLMEGFFCGVSLSFAMKIMRNTELDCSKSRPTLVCPSNRMCSKP